MQQNTNPILDTISRDGTVSPFTGNRPANAVNAYYIKETGHNIPNIFINWLNTRGNWVEIMGFPITESYWATVKVGGVQKVVLMQLFERRALTYTATNKPPYDIEYGNIGQHYFAWRYRPLAVDGAWSGTTSANGAISFTVANHSVTDASVSFDIPGLDLNRIVHPFSPAVPITDNAFSLDMTGLGITITVEGKFTSATDASGSLQIVFMPANGSGSQTVTMTWKAAQVDPKYDGTWHGMTSQKTDIGFKIDKHNFTFIQLRFAIPGYDMYGIDLTPYTPIPIAANNTFMLTTKGMQVPEGTFTFVVTGTFTSPTTVSGNLQVTITSPNGKSGQANATFTASKVATHSLALAPTGQPRGAAGDWQEVRLLK